VTVQNWIDDTRDLPATRAETAVQAPIVHEEVPMLGNYDNDPSVKFLENFPGELSKKSG